MIYLGSNKERPTSNWDEANPKFYVENSNIQYTVEEQKLTVIKEVKSKFSKKNVYYAGSHEGCGCGFRREWFWMQDDKEEIKKTNENQKNLYDYISDCLKNENNIEIYACWAGSENEPAKSERKVSVQEMLNDKFFFKEDEFIIVEK